MCDAERALRRDDLLDEVAERASCSRKAGSSCRARSAWQDGAAALDLLAQELEVLGERAVLRQGVIELLGDEGDRRERRAELVGRRRREAVELRQVLLAGQHQLGRGERLGELARLLGDPPGVDAGEGGAEQDRGPDPGDVEEGQRRAPRPANQGSGRWARTRSVAAADRQEPSARVRSGGSAVAEISTGARNSIAKGFCSPPVR